MASQEISMDVRLRIALADPVSNVSALCRSLGISRETFYVWKRRYERDGLDGLTMRSRAPKHSPGRTSLTVEEAIIGLRKELADRGVDHGPATIQWHFAQRNRCSAPSQATIWRILTRRGFIVPEPHKRPTSSYQRFEASQPNELWQADTTDWVIATGVVKVMSFIDDHSRVALRVRALSAATTEATWDTFCEAANRWGVPVGQLTDNGLNFSGRLRGFEVYFEIQLRHAGVIARTSRPRHPQTCGKVERFQQTMKRWLRCRPLAATLEALQTQLDEFVAYYNEQRPHRAHGMTPAQRWALTPPAINLGETLPSPARRATITVNPLGVVDGHPLRIWVGKRWAGHSAIVHVDDTHFAVFINNRLVRTGPIDHNQPYQRKPKQPRPLA
jgi:transposase InsO family protein